MSLTRDAETGRSNNTHKYSLRHSAKANSASSKQKINASCVKNKTDFLLSLGLNANAIPSSSLHKTHSDQCKNNLMECSVVIETVKCIICELYFKCRTDLIDHWKMKKCNMTYMRQCRVLIFGTKCKVCGRSFKCITDVKRHTKAKHLFKKKSKATVIIKIGDEVMSKVCVRKKHLKTHNINSGMLPLHWKSETSRDVKIAEDEALNSYFRDYYVSQKEAGSNGGTCGNAKSELDDQTTYCESTYNAHAGACDNSCIKEEKSDFAFSSNKNILVKYEDNNNNSIFTFDENVRSHCDSEDVGEDKFNYSVENDLPLPNDGMLISEFHKMSDVAESDQNRFETGYEENLEEIRDAHTVPCMYNDILMMDDEVLLLEDFENMERAKNEFLKKDSTIESKRRMLLNDVTSSLYDAEQFDDEEVVELVRIFNPTTKCGEKEINEVSPTRRERELLMRYNIPDTLDSYEDCVRL
ncbi:uncharacterized protein LOC107264788 [Cephus cinctus]|uniref:Uncharacterized protein LOC107264788 n=1 Tax=Cephus cinctus TaxID=211228 RepID=A0AAJ7RBA0_CEPCN|nr:uncharacterized protein LOC107264788 [Cephus cinctus]